MYLLFFFLICITSVYADEHEPNYDEIQPRVAEDAVPSLVNLTSLPSAIVSGCVNVISGDFCIQDQIDIVSGPSQYILGHSYTSSSLEEGTLGDGWNFLHHQKLSVYSQDSIDYLIPRENEAALVTLLMPPETSHDEEYVDQSKLAFLKNSEEKKPLFIVDEEGDRWPNSAAFEELDPFLFSDDSASESESEDDILIARGFWSRLKKKSKTLFRKICREDRHFPIYLSIFEPSGGRLLFKATFDQKHKYHSLQKFKIVTKKSGFTNVVGGNISAQTNIKNIDITWDKKTKEFFVTLGDGTERTYKYNKINKKNTEYTLHKEVKPNGTIIVYDYNKDGEICEIRTYNKDLSHKLNTITFDQKKPSLFAKNPSLHIKTSDGLEHIYYFKKLDGSYKNGTYAISGIKQDGSSYKRFVYSKKSPRHDRRVVRIEDAETGAYQGVKYYRPGDTYLGRDRVKIRSSKQKKFLRNRVSCLYSPTGPKGEKQITHRFYYYRKGKKAGHTKVVDAEGNKTFYYWNEERRLTSVKKHDKNGNRLMRERYLWGKDKNEGRLIGRILYAEDNHPKLCQIYKYDEAGNIIKDSYYGRFTARGGHLRLSSSGYPEKGSTDKISRRFTYNKRNLKKSERDPNGNYTYFAYDKKTDQCIAIYTCDQEKIQKREFFKYDINGVVIKKIVDDGSSRDKKSLRNVTQRHITVIVPRKKRPHFGEPEEVIEYSLDLKSNKKIFLKKTVNQYSSKGFIVKQRIYDQADAHVIYTYSYDRVGRLRESIDPQGNKELYSYDKAGRLVSKRGPHPDLLLRYRYDKAGRVSSETEQMPYATLKTTYGYDALGRKASVRNSEGNKILYRYDPLNRLTKVIHPPIYSYKGKKIVSTCQLSYEKLGAKIIYRDENRQETVVEKNALGKTLFIQYPDKTIRSFIYDKNSNCIEEHLQNDAIRFNSYDGLNRLYKTRLFKDKNELSRTSTTYNGFHVVSEHGPSGEKTSYTYDLFGRKVSITQSGPSKENRKTTLVYDERSRLRREQTHLDNNYYLAKSLRYDDLDQLIYEVGYDSVNTRTKNRYLYDEEGNVCSTTRYISGQEAVDQINYYPHKRLYFTVDPEGNTTKYRYNHGYQNAYGQKVLSVEISNARKMKTVQVFDARSNLSEVKQFDPFGTLLTRKNFFYDRAQNLVRTQEFVIEDGIEKQMITTRYLFGPLHRIEAIIEACGTPEEKTTRYTYNRYGQKDSVVFADGTSLFYSYDGKGRVDRYYSSDGTIDYSYRYDLSDRILEIKNNINHRSTTRSYNDFGEIISETLETGIAFRYRHDKAGRVTKVKLPDRSSILYKYSPSFLEAVIRKDAKKNERYRFSIAKRDMAGFIQQAELPGNNGALFFEKDRCGRTRAILHDQFSEVVPPGGFDPTGNLLLLFFQDQKGAYDRQFSYDYLSQLQKESGLYNHTYGHDSLFNRIKKDDEVNEVNALHAVVSCSNTQYTYDLRGNRIESSDGVSYRYDALDRLTEVITPKGVYSYSYDGFNRRISKSANGKTTEYLYLFENEIGAMEENTIKELRVLSSGLGAEIGAAVAMELYGKTYFPLHDRQGSVRALISTSGEVKEHYRFDAFGNEEIFSEEQTGNPWRFSSKRIDPETGLSYFGRRYYDPYLGKWLTQDPLGLKAGPNLYAYVLNNPMTSFDAHGLYVDTEETKWKPYDCRHPVVREYGRQRLRQTYKAQGYKLDHGGLALKNKKEYTSIRLENRPDPADFTVVYVPGLNTPFENSIEQAMYLSDKFGGCQVNVIQNFTYGLPVDGVRAFFEERSLYSSEAVQDLQQFVSTTRETKGDTHRFFIVGFSEGAIITRNAFENINDQVKDRSHIVAVCPGTLVDHSAAKDTVNLVNNNIRRDIVPYLSALGKSNFNEEFLREAANSGMRFNIEYIQSHPEASRFDHDVTSPSYSNKIDEHFNQFSGS